MDEWISPEGMLILVYLIGVFSLIAWLIYFIGWHRGYKKASDLEISRIPATMGLGFIAGRMVEAHKASDEPASGMDHG